MVGPLVTSFTRVAISLMQHLRKGKSLALKIYDTFDKSAMKNPGECLFSCGHVIVCDFLDFAYLLFFFFSEALLKNVPVERATLLRRLMRKTTSFKKT